MPNINSAFDRTGSWTEISDREVCYCFIHLVFILWTGKWKNPMFLAFQPYYILCISIFCTWWITSWFIKEYFSYKKKMGKVSPYPKCLGSKVCIKVLHWCFKANIPNKQGKSVRPGPTLHILACINHYTPASNWFSNRLTYFFLWKKCISFKTSSGFILSILKSCVEDPDQPTSSLFIYKE